MFYFIETAKRKRKNYNEIYSCALTRTQKYGGKKSSFALASYRNKKMEV